MNYTKYLNRYFYTEISGKTAFSVLKSLKVFAAAVLTLMVFASAAFGQETWDCGAESNDGGAGSVTCTLDADGTFTVSGTGAMRDYGKGLNPNPPWNNYKSSIINAVIEDGVTAIGNHAFNSCNKLKSITIPGSVAIIGERAFYYCRSLASVTLPEGVTIIGDRAFYYCDSLTSFTMPSRLTSIGQFAFSHCSSLKSIDIPEGVTDIDGLMFDACISLTHATLPASLSNIAVTAFSDCISLLSIDVNENNTVYSSVDGVLFSKEQDTLFKYPSGKPQSEYTVPASVIALGMYGTFHKVAALTTLTIPNVISIPTQTFNNSKRLATIILGDGVTTIQGWAFSRCSSITTIEMSRSVTTLHSGAFEGFYSLISINVSEDNPEFSSENGVLFNKDKTVLLKYPTGRQGAYTIPDGVTNIAMSAFQYCSGLTSLTIPISVDTINSRAFDRCDSLTSVISLDTVPPFVGGYTFIIHYEAVLYVPANSIEAYRQTPGWRYNGDVSSGFRSIRDINDYISVKYNGAAAQRRYGSKVRLRNKRLTVTQPPESVSHVRLTDIRGRTVANFTAHGRTDFSLAGIAAGRYFVEIRTGKQLDKTAIMVGVR